MRVDKVFWLINLPKNASTKPSQYTIEITCEVNYHEDDLGSKVYGKSMQATYSWSTFKIVKSI